MFMYVCTPMLLACSCVVIWWDIGQLPGPGATCDSAPRAGFCLTMHLVCYTHTLESSSFKQRGRISCTPTHPTADLGAWRYTLWLPCSFLTAPCATLPCMCPPQLADPEHACRPFTFTNFDETWVALIARQKDLEPTNCTFDVKVSRGIELSSADD